MNIHMAGRSTHTNIRIPIRISTHTNIRTIAALIPTIMSTLATTVHTTTSMTSTNWSRTTTNTKLQQGYRLRMGLENSGGLQEAVGDRCRWATREQPA